MNTNRRKFIQQSAAATTAAFIHPLLQNISDEKILSPATPGYELIVLATDWGFNGNRDAFCAAAKKEGYDGIEVWWPDDAKAQDELFTALDKHGLKVGFLCGGWQENPKEHLESFTKFTTDAATNKRKKPLYINCHSGRDFFSIAQNRPFIQHTDKLSRESGVPVYHETHRGRILFAAHITKQYLELEPSLRLTLDISHWCNVHESMLEDQAATLQQALARTGHIHARIGHPEGPQVNDPRAPEWAVTIQKHIEWWDVVVKDKRAKGEPMTFLTEFGPADYMPTLPYTKREVADQWAINVHMMQLLRKRYS